MPLVTKWSGMSWRPAEMAHKRGGFLGVEYMRGQVRSFVVFRIPRRRDQLTSAVDRVVYLLKSHFRLRP